MNFGFTNDRSELNRVAAYREAALADGWSIAPTYEREPQDSACTLRRNGYTLSILSRVKDPARSKYKYECTVHIWRPDGLSVEPPSTYNMEAIIANASKCDDCGESADVSRVGFANKACTKCLPAMRKRIEKMGWRD